ncbi:MAG: FHA domain-containing protein [Planctomycetota bacterium]|jgi:pSer/pThr/pTyr-binding forkhead associated (FHA) protein
MSAKLLVKEGSQVGKEFQLGRLGSFSIGRGSDNNLSVVEKAISRKHCRIDFDGEFYWLVDCGSHNGTSVNGRPITKCLLYDGDMIHIGHTKMLFCVAEGHDRDESTAF